MDVSLIENQVDIESLDQFAAIIGESPSKGARSPELWNKVFSESGLNYRMVPLDVNKEKVEDLLNSLNEDKKFLGGAVAIPYKEVVAKWLGRNITSEAKKIGAVNCLYRNSNSQLHGTNTDGEASLKTFNDKFGFFNDKSVMILGVGGAGKAVASYFSNNAKSTIIISRSKGGNQYAGKIGATWKEWGEIDNYINSIDVLVNCTSVGFETQDSSSPLSENQIANLRKSTIVFDIIYQPLETKLLTMAKKRNLATLNGLKMNLEQAVIAYQYAVKPNKTSDQVFQIMSQI